MNIPWMTRLMVCHLADRSSSSDFFCGSRVVVSLFSARICPSGASILLTRTWLLMISPSWVAWGCCCAAVDILDRIRPFDFASFATVVLMVVIVFCLLWVVWGCCAIVDLLNRMPFNSNTNVSRRRTSTTIRSVDLDGNFPDIPGIREGMFDMLSITIR